MALTPQIRHTHGVVEVLLTTTPTLRVTQALVEVLMNTVIPPSTTLVGELDHRTLTTATGALNATWTGTTSGNWTAGLVALKKT